MNNSNNETWAGDPDPDYFSDYLPETITIGILIFVAIMCFFVGNSQIIGACVFTVAILAHVSGSIGKHRRIGYRNAFWVGFLIPIVGLIVALVSPTLDPYAEIRIEEKQPSVQPNTIEQLGKLQELREKGVLTDDEFAEQKNKLLNT